MSEWLKSKTPITVYAGQDVVKGGHLFPAGGSANLYSHIGNQYGDSRKVGNSLPQYPAIQLLGKYPKEAYS